MDSLMGLDNSNGPGREREKENFHIIFSFSNPFFCIISRSFLAYRFLWCGWTTGMNQKGLFERKGVEYENESFREKWVPSITNMYLQSKTHFTYDLDIFQIISTLDHPHTLQTIWILLRSSGYFSNLCKSFADLLNHLIIVRPSGSFLDEPNISKYSWLSSPGPQVFSNVFCIGREL